MKSNVKVLLGEVYQGKWYSPGGQSSFAKLVRDAGGRYIFSSNQQETPIILSLESFFEKSKNKKIGFWILNNNWKTQRDILKSERRLKKLVNLNPITIFNTKEPRVFWEKMYPEVDVYLKDLAAVFSNKKQTDLVWIRKVNE